MKKSAKIICIVLVISLISSFAFADTTYGVWIVKRYIDEFQEATGDKYAMNTKSISGSFSNSVTTNSPAYMDMLIDWYNTCIVLYEYSYSSIVKNYSSNIQEYTIKLRANGVDKTFTGSMNANGGDRIFVDDPFGMDAFLANYPSVSIYIETYMGSIKNSYLFSNIETTGFFDAAVDIYGSYPNINVVFNKTTEELNKPIIATYSISDGRSDYRGIAYEWNVFDGSEWTTAQSGELTTMSGTLSFTPTDGIGVALWLYVWDSPKIHSSTYPHIYLQSVFLDLPEDTTRIESEAFVNIGHIVHVSIPDGVSYIADDAFVGNDQVILYGNYSDSIAEQYASSHANCSYYEGYMIKPYEN